jgi:hypothetical protein
VNAIVHCEHLRDGHQLWLVVQATFGEKKLFPVKGTSGCADQWSPTFAVGGDNPQITDAGVYSILLYEIDSDEIGSFNSAEQIDRALFKSEEPPQTPLSTTQYTRALG